MTAPPHVTLFVYRSAEEKRRWVGAAQTDYTKPWLAQIDLTAQPLPHPVLRHELVHAVASVLAPGPLHLPARGRLLPSLALVVGAGGGAGDPPRRRHRPRVVARGARPGPAPRPAAHPGAGRLLGQAPARAYTAAGLQQLGDLRWLAGDRAGAAGRFEEALGAGPGPAEERALRARLAALADPGLAEALGPWLRGDGDPALALARVARAPGPLARYLLARAQLTRGEPQAALRELEALDPAALPAPSLTVEARRMRAEAQCEAGEREGGVAAWAALAAGARAEGRGALAEQAEDAVARCSGPSRAGSPPM